LSNFYRKELNYLYNFIFQNYLQSYLQSLIVLWSLLYSHLSMNATSKTINALICKCCWCLFYKFLFYRYKLILEINIMYIPKCNYIPQIYHNDTKYKTSNKYLATRDKWKKTQYLKWTKFKIQDCNKTSSNITISIQTLSYTTTFKED